MKKMHVLYIKYMCVFFCHCHFCIHRYLVFGPERRSWKFPQDGERKEGSKLNYMWNSDESKGKKLRDVKKGCWKERKKKRKRTKTKRNAHILNSREFSVWAISIFICVHVANVPIPIIWRKVDERQGQGLGREMCSCCWMMWCDGWGWKWEWRWILYYVRTYSGCYV